MDGYPSNLPIAEKLPSYRGSDGNAAASTVECRGESADRCREFGAGRGGAVGSVAARSSPQSALCVAAAVLRAGASGRAGRRLRLRSSGGVRTRAGPGRQLGSGRGGDRGWRRGAAGGAGRRDGLSERRAARHEGLVMIAPAAGVRILIATQPIDFRKGADGLAAIAQHVLEEDPFAGTVIVFRARRGDRVKLLVWDGTGLVLIWKRLERGAFKWPSVSDRVIRLSAAQLAILLEGLDWSRLAALPVVRPRLAQ